MSYNYATKKHSLGTGMLDLIPNNITYKSQIIFYILHPDDTRLEGW